MCQQREIMLCLSWETVMAQQFFHLVTPLQHSTTSVITIHTVQISKHLVIFFTKLILTSHNETKAIALFVQTDVDCL